MIASPTSITEHVISLEQAVDMTRRYRENREQILSEEFKGSDVLALSETFSKKALAAFFENENCEYIRVYFGMDKEMKVHSILVGADGNNEDLLPETLDGENVILEDARRCPTDCPPPSDLNTD